MSGPSGRATSVTATAAGDVHATVTSSEFRALLELRSTWFASALLSLQPQAKTVTYGGAVSLTGFARGADSVGLEAKSAASDWAPAGELILDADGSFATVVKPLAATQYRLSWQAVRGRARDGCGRRARRRATRRRQRPGHRAPGGGRRSRSAATAGRGGLDDGLLDRREQRRLVQLRRHVARGHLPRSLRAGPRTRRRSVGDVLGAVKRALLLARGARGARGAGGGRSASTTPSPTPRSEWYLDQDQAWSFWPTVPHLAPVKVAVIDSGIDGSHPDLAGRVVAAKSFVGGSAYRDEQGHGTFVAGEIAANPANGIGMAGLAFNARLIVAKVVGAGRDGLAACRGRRDPLGGRRRARG